MTLWHMVSAEWTKLWSVRSTAWSPPAAVAVVAVLAVVVALTGSLQPDDTILGASVTSGGTLGLLIVAAWAATVSASEYTTGMALSTFTACPRRDRVLAAKTVVVVATAGVVGVSGAGAAWLVGRRLLVDTGHAPGELMPALLGIGAVFASTAVVGVALGFVVRHAAGAMAAGMGVVLVPVLAGPLMGPWQPWLVGPSPAGVLQKLAQSSDAVPTVVGTLGAWPSLAVLGAGSAVLLLGARTLVGHRDA